ncbi:MAG: hypothetical protein NTY48_03220 [Candidatus Diapherotrites archaeon]|nr:hypothetical protein [Candidatus Diapherotrites archaeon]
MQVQEEKVEALILEINALHDAVSRMNWATLNREGFVFELEQNTKRLKEIFLKLGEINRETKLLLEKSTPSLDILLEEITRELTILETNIAMKKKKRLRQELVNETETIEVPALYSSLQQKLLSLALKCRYNIDRVRNFYAARKMPFVQKGSTAKHLLEALQLKEEELTQAKQKNIELKRKTYFGNLEEKNIVEIESELHEMDKKLDESVLETKKSLKTHFAQINYVEGSFIHLKNRVEEIESTHSAFAKKSLELIKELKKERDYAKTLALEIEKDTLEKRSEYTKQILSIEDKKQQIEERLSAENEKTNSSLKKSVIEKEAALKQAHKIIERLEEEINALKKK